ncbi:MAG TPA: N-acetylmuramoyl-L-alanine amidase [Candidatus Manganitrophaceae bacterium]|nr:N-acetylmuramoyl-L-alanine amidase [Candidatus Manganitrophaceae bacterium]
MKSLIPQRTESIILLTLLVLLFCSLFFPPAPAPAAQGSLQEADACRDGLKENPARKKTQSAWEGCIEKYKNAAALPDDKSRASYEIARLYQERYLYLNLPKDLAEARAYYGKFLEVSAEEPQAADARNQIDKLRRVLGDAPEESLDANPPIEISERTSKGAPKGTAVVANIRHWAYPTYTRIVVDLDRSVSYKVVRSTTSPALSVTLSHATLGELFKRTRVISVAKELLKKIEVKPKEGDEIDLLLSFGKLGRYKVMPLSDPARLVIDAFYPEEAPSKKGIEIDDQVNAPQKKVVIPSPPSLAIRTIVIDPGHGGKDPGAIGSRGLTEKEVVLDVSHRLKTLIQKQLKKEVLMTRHDDVFIPLDERTLLANNKKADLFVSVHANSSPKRNTQGIEVYLLGRATDENAIAVAARENATSHKDALDFQEVILNDLQRDFTLNQSLEFAHFTQNAFVKNLIPSYPTETLGVKRAPFFVLAHTNMPAILAEISFISNPVEEKRLKNPNYRQKVAEALFIGIKEYIHSLEFRS